MTQGAQRVVPEDLDGVRQRVEQWRATRLKRGAMPEGLWSDAVAAAEQHGVWLVSRVLRVNYDNLKARLVPSGGIRSGSKMARRETAISTCVPGFVELSGAESSSLLGDSVAVVVEMSSPDGARLVIRAPRGAGLDLRGLVDGFWRRGA